MDLPEEWRDIGGELAHAIAATRPRADENQPPHEVGSIDRDLLGDVSAHRVAEEIDLLEPQCVEE